MTIISIVLSQAANSTFCTTWLYSRESSVAGQAEMLIFLFVFCEYADKAVVVN